MSSGWEKRPTVPVRCFLHTLFFHSSDLTTARKQQKMRYFRLIGHLGPHSQTFSVTRPIVSDPLSLSSECPSHPFRFDCDVFFAVQSNQMPAMVFKLIFLTSYFLKTHYLLLYRQNHSKASWLTFYWEHNVSCLEINIASDDSC